MSSENSRIGVFVLKYRRSIGVVLLLITAFMAWNAAHIKAATKFENLFPAQHRAGGADALAPAVLLADANTDIYIAGLPVIVGWGYHYFDVIAIIFLASMKHFDARPPGTASVNAIRQDASEKTSLWSTAGRALTAF